jgi:hypothetical protein
MVVLVRTPPVEVRRRPVATEVMVAAAGWVVQEARAAALALWAPTATVAMEVPAARPELPVTVVMGARVILRTPMVQQEVMAVILEPQELAVRVVLPESVELQVRLGSAARPDPTRHPAVMAAMAAMDLTTLRVPVDLVEPEAMAVPSATVGMAASVEVGLGQALKHLFSAGLAVPGGTEVPPAATAVPAEREALQMHLERHQRLSAGLAVPGGTEVPPAATAVSAEREALQMHWERDQWLSAVMAAMEGIPAGSVGLEV